ncbi:ATP-dependent DNA helicase RecG [Geothermobacter ehrlichii]|uniref:ATP-dependent DNA helicase RecG n=1 Tax=Geothermobacter ehrlichii TaxID=213224 RepID=A0A5D3WN80_9BACT|nr:ATP-dependent DNA helicase RecG [Geothermobacter ehrlichii]TYP00321.1 ATP-dependent DNA helicase RecG [Geothermobacter ehrlichii]
MCADSSHLHQPLSVLHGVGPRLADRFARMQIRSVEDLLYTLPHRYEDRRQLRKIAHLREGCTEIFCGEILASAEVRTSRSGRAMWEVVVGDGSGTITLKWFHYRKAWQKKTYQVGRRALFRGEVKRFAGRREVLHPEADFLAPGQDVDDFTRADPLNFGRILPVYPLTDGLHQRTARKIWKEAVDRFAAQVKTHLPAEFLRKRSLPPLDIALRQVHWPDNDADLSALQRGDDPCRRALVYDEFFYLELGLLLRQKGISLEAGIPFRIEHRYTRPLAAMLPYRLTAAQKRVLGEIKRDLQRPHPMHRLVQGDVGSGKTVVALMAALLAIENETQVAVVAPTEILAEQHYRFFSHWLERLGLKTALLSGTQKPSDKQRCLERIAAGEVHLVVGTHAVLQEGVRFSRLGLGIVDEQHRFGVQQRQVLKQKGENPHILVMTATPIPRSLALTVYGDLALSVIDELPPGRKPVKTLMCGEKERERALILMKKAIQRGEQGYIVYPLVEESEKSDLKAATEAMEWLTGFFPDVRLALLHGRMKGPEKDAVMRDFAEGRTGILVATTVIEVGIDVPNATVMIVEHAERFGLAQLHQLRGRVGRGGKESVCVLIRSQKCSEDGLKRLQVMCETGDGFRIAEADLEIRGPGDFLGTRQSGVPDFRIANILRDGQVLEQARQDAMELVARDDFPDHPRYHELMQALAERWGGRLELASIG